MNEKRCIFHYPHPLVVNPSAGSQLRPKMMLEAFERIGYSVDAVSGYGRERKAKIKTIKHNIKNGIIYDFMYSESLTQPTLLAEEDHIPRHPILDFEFFKFCKRKHVPIGLFYRDMHWKFDVYKQAVPFYKRAITIPLYQWDLFMYHRFLNVLFCATDRIVEYGLKNFDIVELPPGCKWNKEICEYKKNRIPEKGQLKLLYVGGVNGIYNPYNIIKAVSECDNIFLTICTSESHWDTYKNLYANIMSEQIQIIHKRSSELPEYYKEADASILCQAPNLYMDIASPIKAKETLGYGTPIIISNNIKLSDEVVKGNYGWKVDANVEDIKKLLMHLLENPDEIREKTIGAIEAGKKNTWERRAEQAASILRKRGE